MFNRIIKISLVLLLTVLVSCFTGDDDLEESNDPFDKSVQAIEIKDNVVWVGTAGNGLYKFENDIWNNYTSEDGLLSDEITSLVVDNDGSVWMGTKMGVAKLEGENITTYTTDDGLYVDDIRSITCDDENNIWIGTSRNRVIKFDGTNFTTHHVNAEFSGEPGMGHIHTLACDNDGNVWAGSCMTGLSRFDGTNWSDYVNDLNVFVTSSACSSGGEVWIGHISGAYSCYNNEWTHYSEETGMSDNTVLSVDIDGDENVWVGTKNGISEFDGSSWFNYAIEDTLFNDYVSSLACARDGKVWIGNSYGLKIVTP